MNRRGSAIALLLLIIGFGLIAAACGKKIRNPDITGQRKPWKWFNYSVINTNQSKRTSLESITPPDHFNYNGGRIQVLVWTNYFSQAVLNSFTEKFGISVDVTLYESNDQLDQLLRAGTNYALAMPTGFFVDQLVAENRLVRIQTNNIPNLRLLDPQFVALRGGEAHLNFAVPYLWGVVGYGYNKSAVPFFPAGWSDIFNPPPEAAAGLQSKVAMLEEPRDLVAAALLYLGFDPAETNAATLDLALKAIQKQKEDLNVIYDSSHIAEWLASGRTLMAQAWSADIARAMHLNSSIRFALPREGVPMFIDHLTIPAGVTERQRAMAEVFINYLLEPVVAARVSNFSYYANTVSLSHAYIDSFVRRGPSFIAPTDVTKIHHLSHLPETRLFYNRFWKNVGVNVDSLAPIRASH